MTSVIRSSSFQPSDYQEFTSQLHQRNVSEVIPVEAEVVRVDVSGKSFSRLTDYRR